MPERSEDRARAVFSQYDECVRFNNGVGLYETVEANENFFVGRQWEGVRANGLPTPVFNFIKRVVLYLVSSLVSDSLTLHASPMNEGEEGAGKLAELADERFRALFERSNLPARLREMMRGAAVDGDGCLYVWFDPQADAAGGAKGEIVIETVDNTRVLFGNPTDQNVQAQPYILLAARELIEDVRRRAAHNGAKAEEIVPDSDETGNRFDELSGGKCTVIRRMRRDPDSGRILALECSRGCVIRPEWDTGLTLYPVVWQSWDRVQNNYHGQAAVTGLIPNQIFVNRMFAMTMMSLMTTAYPKIVYDANRIPRWDSRVGAAIPVLGGDISGVASIVDPAHISPQVSQFIELAIAYTRDFMGATDAALGNVRPDNTSAIIALQRASAVPLELLRQELMQSIEDLGRILLDHMAAYYGVRGGRDKDTA